MGQVKDRLARALVMRALSDRSGSTAVEYAAIASLIAAVIAAIVFQAGANLEANFYSHILDAFN